MKTQLATLALSLAAPLVAAQGSPVGLWRTIDDETNRERSLVRISETAGVLSGRIEKITDPAKQDARCDKCSDGRKDKPVLGMTIVEGVKKNADEPWWDGGTILDPNNGKVYKVRLTPQGEGRTMQVRGFVGPFYRNQIWQRVE